MLIERDVIGALLINDDAIDKTIPVLTAEMFEDRFCGDAYAEIVRCHNAGVEIDFVTLTQKLAGDRLTDVIVRDRLAEYMQNCGSSVNIVRYAETVRDAYRARKVAEILNHTRPDHSNVDKQIREAMSGLENLLVSTKTEKTVGEIASENRESYFKANARKRINLGFEWLDHAIGGIECGDVVVIAARPAVGKSAFALQVITNMASDGLRVGYFNLEMQEGQIYERLLAAKSGLELSRIRLATNFLGDEKQKFDAANEELMRQDRISIYSGSRGVMDIRAEVKGKGYDVIVIDYLQLLRSDGRRGANRYAEVGDISRGIKDIAMSCNIPVIALSQLNRASEGKKDFEPSMSELRESGDIEQDASVVMMLWAPSQEDRSLRKVKVEKARQGSGITQELYFDGGHMTFGEWTHAYDFMFE